MKVTDGCYCGDVRYDVEGDPIFKAECFCRECQYITGGNSLLAMAMPASTFTLTKGEVKAFARPDLRHPVTREFCGRCGTHLFTRAISFPQGVIVKVGTMDNPADFAGADTANFVKDAQPFHRLPQDMPLYQGWME